MKFRWSSLVLTLGIFLALTTSAFAHAGPPFIKVNGNSTIQNAVYAGSNLFKIPYENSPETYLVGEKINFSADTKLLPVDPTIISQSKFTWYFGDDKTATSLNSSHVYTKPGSYFVSLKVTDPSYGEEVELENLQLDIRNKNSDILPHAIIKVNGKKVNDPLKAPFVVTKGETINFDASDSSGDIKDYKWDFGDGSKLETSKKVQHVFSFKTPYTYSIFPLLRVEDKNGLISDNFVQISNSITDSTGKSVPSSNTNSLGNKDSGIVNYLVGASGIAILVSIGFLFFKNMPKKKAAP